MCSFQLDPTAGKEFMGFIVAANPLGQMIFSPLFGWWSNKLKSIRVPLLVSMVSVGKFWKYRSLGHDFFVGGVLYKQCTVLVARLAQGRCQVLDVHRSLFRGRLKRKHCSVPILRLGRHDSQRAHKLSFDDEPCSSSRFRLRPGTPISRDPARHQRLPLVELHDQHVHCQRLVQRPFGRHQFLPFPSVLLQRPSCCRTRANDTAGQG